MYTIILLSILSIVGLVGGYFIDKYTYSDGWAATFITTGALSLASLVVAIAFLFNLDHRFDAISNSYDNIVQMVESYDGQDYGNMGSLVEAVVEMNKEIAIHKAQYNSKWVGLWHSERIANLAPITFSPKRVEPVQTE
jgi:hypothetical protein